MNGQGLIQSLQEMIGNRRAERQEISAQLQLLDQEIATLEGTIRLYREDHNIAEPEPIFVPTQGKTLSKQREDAIVQWARSNGNVLLPRKAKRDLLAAGLFNNPQTAGWIIYGMLGNMDCWEKLKPGVYRLVESTRKRNGHEQEQSELVEVR